MAGFLTANLAEKLTNKLLTNYDSTTHHQLTVGVNVAVKLKS